MRGAETRTAGRRIRPWLLVAAGLWALAAGGCSGLQPAPSPLGQSSCGRILFDARTRGLLSVVQHTCRRDRFNHLVVLVVLRNNSGGDYLAKVRIKFVDADGMFEKQSFNMDYDTLPPGETRMEWSSSSAGASSYVIEVRGGRIINL